MSEEKMAKAIDTAGELYREMKKRGLHLRKENGRDSALIVELRNKLQCPDQNFQAFLDTSDLTAEQFLRVFLDVAQPFARMFSEIWDFLSNNYAPKALETVAVRFGFPESHDATILNLEQFRRYAETSKRVVSLTRIYFWSYEALNKLFKIGRILLPQNDIPYWKSYSKHGSYVPGEPYTVPKPLQISHPFDKILVEIAGLFQKIIGNYAIEYQIENSQKHLPELKRRDFNQGESLRKFAYLLTDLLPTWFYILDNSETITGNLKNKVYTIYKTEIEHLKSNNMKTYFPILEALDILDLPFWRHRWHTFEVWATIITLRALEEYQPIMKIVDGYIPIDGYSDTIVANINVEGFPNACVGLQIQTPFEKDMRKGIKPDLRVCFSDELLPEQTASIVEFKQRSKMDSKYLEEIARAYSEGSPKSGGTIILNYDVTNVNVLFPPNSFLIEGMQPNNLEKIRIFNDSLISILNSIGFRPKYIVVMVLLDVSGSMGYKYNPEKVQRTLKSLLDMRWIKVLRFNDGLVLGGDLNMELCSNIHTSGGTKLGQAIKEIELNFSLPSKMLIVTDGEHDNPTEILKRIPHIRECTPDELEENLSWLYQ